MSVPVPIDALQERIDEFGAGAFLITTKADGQVHVVSTTAHVDGALLVVAGAGRTSRANLAANPWATVLWARSPDGAYSLIVDGRAGADSADDGALAITPTHAVLHRLADASAALPRCVPVEDPGG